MARKFGGKPQADLVVVREHDILGATVDGVPYFGMPGAVKKMKDSNGNIVVDKDGKPVLDGGTAQSLIDDTDQDVVIFLLKDKNGKTNHSDAEAFKDAIALYRHKTASTGTVHSDADELSALFASKSAPKKPESKEPNFNK